MLSTILAVVDEQIFLGLACHRGQKKYFSLAVCIEKRFSKLLVNYISSAVCFCFDYVGNVVGDYVLSQILNVVKYCKVCTYSRQ